MYETLEDHEERLAAAFAKSLARVTYRCPNDQCRVVTFQRGTSETPIKCPACYGVVHDA